MSDAFITHSKTDEIRTLCARLMSENNKILTVKFDSLQYFS